MSVDILAIGAHPDDVDLAAGGTLCKLASAGYRIVIADLSRGELSSRGTPDERVAEAQEAAAILGVTKRVCANLRDGSIANTPEQRTVVGELIRAHRPKVLLGHMGTDRHPDHRAAHELTRDANFFAGVSKAWAAGEPHRASHIHYFRPYYEDETPPLFVVDISGHFEKKMEALRAYKSQFHNPAYTGPATYISSERFWTQIRTRAEYWGGRIGVSYGEPFFGDGPLGIDSLPGLIPIRDIRVRS